MAINRSHRKRANSKARTRRRGQRGGNSVGNPSSAWGYVSGTVGNGWTQFMNSLTLQPGENLGTTQSNAIVPVNNINAQNIQGNIGPNMRGDIPQAGGKKRRNNRSCVKRGGNLLAVAEQAAIPITLFAMNNSLGKGRSKSRRHRHR